MRPDRPGLMSARSGSAGLGAATSSHPVTVRTRGWLEELRKTPNAGGIMYTTWLNKYDRRADFGQLVSQ